MLQDQAGVTPGLAVVFASAGVDVPTEMMVHEAKEKRSVAESFYAWIIKAVFNEVMTFYGSLCHYLMSVLVKAYSDIDFFIRMYAAC